MNNLLLLYFQGHFKFPNPKKWTDEELGIPPEDEWTFIFYVVIYKVLKMNTVYLGFDFILGQ